MGNRLIFLYCFIGNQGTKETKLKLLLDFSGSIKVLIARIKTMLELRCDPYTILV